MVRCPYLDKTPSPGLAGASGRARRQSFATRRASESPMPDWIIHMGAAHGASRLRGRWNLCWLFLGSVLPDALPRVLGSVLTLVPPLRPLATGPVQLYLSFLHTPLVVAFLGAALVALARHRRMAALALSFGVLTHFLLDLLQKSCGGGTSLLFPVDLTGFSLQVAWYENPATYVLVVLLAPYLWYVARGWRRDPLRPADSPLAPWSRRSVGLSCLLLGVALALPVPFIDRAIEMNVGASLLATDPRLFENQVIGLPVASVKEVDEQRVYVEVMAEVFGIDRAWLPDVERGDHVSVRGTYREGRVEPEWVFVHDYTFKRAASLVGGVLLLLVWIPALRGRSRST